MSAAQRLRLTWGDVNEALGRVARAVTSDNVRPDVLVAVARGGLAPAAVLAHRLGVQHVVSVLLQGRRPDGSKGKVSNPDVVDFMRLKELRQLAIGGASLLVVDDVLDSGDTLSLMRTHLPSAHLAVVAYKGTEGDFRDNWPRTYAGSLYTQQDWLSFPWEVE